MNFKEILSNNFRVERIFDNHHDGYIGGRMSKEEAIKEKKRIQGTGRGRYKVSYQVRECLAIIGIIPMNGGEAYIFNVDPKPCNSKEHEQIRITSRTFEELMDCYVFMSSSFSKKIGNELEEEYYQRGGKKFDTYHSFENECLKPIRKERQKVFKEEIFDVIKRHHFGLFDSSFANDDGVVINLVKSQRASIDYGIPKSHLDLEIGINEIMYIGSIFSQYRTEYAQLTDNLVRVTCKRRIGKDGLRHDYHALFFEIQFK